MIKNTAILTGDIIDSRQDKEQAWLATLKEILGTFGKMPKTWEIYRGDSFQAEVKPAEALEKALMIKTYLKQQKDIDVRIGIGIGEKTYDAAKITESNGTAFIHSGESFEGLKKQTIAVKTPWPEFDETTNVMLSLALLNIDNWKPATATIMKTVMENKDQNQQAIAEILQITQSSISEGLKRGGYEEILSMLNLYKTLMPAT